MNSNITITAAGQVVLHDRQTREQEAGGALETIFLNGAAYNFQSLETIRGRLLA